MEWFTAPEYWFSRLVLERGIAALYLLAFVSSARQFRALIGEHGMQPIPRLLARTSFRATPSIFHFRYSDRFFAIVAWSGAALSATVLAGGANLLPLWGAMLIWLAIWLLYLSIFNVGQRWYSFMWEVLLLEAGFLAIFLGNDDTAPSVLVMWLARWLLFRLEFGAGLIKLRRDKCWRDLTCLDYHHETQPMPGPLSWCFHQLPKPVHRLEVLGNHFAQLVVPFGLFAPQPVASIAGAIIVTTQLWLILSGNFAWLNWLAILLAFSAIDVSWLGAAPWVPHPSALPEPPWWFVGLVGALAVLVVVLSYYPVRNLLSREQRMNKSFNPLRLVNTYGAFGTVLRVRIEVVIEGTDEHRISNQTVWKEYEFKGKPGDPRRLPRQWAPYHLRLDWVMWFVGRSPHDERLLRSLLLRLLKNDRMTLRLLRHNPFPDLPPRYVRVQLYRYRFTTPQELRRDGAWWHRSLVRPYVRPVGLRVTTNPDG